MSVRGSAGRIGQGRKFKLKRIDRLLMLLVYYRLYITYALTGFLFDLDQSNVCRNMEYLEPLGSASPLPKRVYKATKRIGDMEGLLICFPELEAFLDATEQEIPRPKNKRRRKSYWKEGETHSQDADNNEQEWADNPHHWSCARKETRL